jgi:hypothetical protein
MPSSSTSTVAPSAAGPAAAGATGAAAGIKKPSNLMAPTNLMGGQSSFIPDAPVQSKGGLTANKSVVVVSIAHVYCIALFYPDMHNLCMLSVNVDVVVPAVN